MGVLEKVGDRWTERGPQKRLQRDATQRAPILKNGQQCLAQKKNKSQTLLLCPLPTWTAEF